MTSTSDLLALEHGTTTQEALTFFDNLEPIRAEELIGQRWHGGEVPTGHSMDGILTVSGWYGKQFDDVDHVHPLLFSDGGGDIFAVDPMLAPMGLAGRVSGLTESPMVKRTSPTALSALKPLIRTTKHRARLRNIEFRGVVSAAMVYDHKAIIDHFRKVDDATLLGIMDLRDMDQPYFFTLRRD
ncbi:Uncharacterised protein [Mycobacteroides abscessus]|nr:Uncharacterised protein [Mycobacteroides abscessus]